MSRRLIHFVCYALLSNALGCAGTSVRTQGHGDDDVTGRCELTRDGAPGPCDGITLFLRDRASGDEHRTRPDGYDFRFADLRRRSYVLSATAAGFDVETNVRDEVTPGQSLRLKLRVTPHR